MHGLLCNDTASRELSFQNLSRTYQNLSEVLGGLWEALGGFGKVLEAILGGF